MTDKEFVTLIYPDARLTFCELSWRKRPAYIIEVKGGCLNIGTPSSKLAWKHARDFINRCMIYKLGDQ